MHLISLIIPIYNAEEYLDSAIDSIINQSIGFENIELILVDDFSTDNSRKIIEKYATEYNNIIPIYSDKNHGNPGFGRNIGLKKSTSKYIMFMDNDDKLDKDICKKLYETISNENADIVCCDTLIVDNISVKKDTIPYTNGIESDKFVIIENENMFFFKNNSVWNKIYKKEIITDNDIKFKEDTYADDLIFILSYFLKSKKLIYLKNYFGYIWNIRSKSLSHYVKKEHIYELLNAYNYIGDLFKKENKIELINTIFSKHIGFLIIQCTYLDTNKNETEEILKEIHDFEIKYQVNKLNKKLPNFINFFILHEKYIIARLLLKIVNNLRKLEILRKINRKLNINI